jgi:UDP-glucose 4-epimerase
MEVKHAYCSSEKARRILDYKTTTPLRIGIRKMVDWVRREGPRSFKYWNRLEITKKAPEVWTKKLQ